MRARDTARPCDSLAQDGECAGEGDEREAPSWGRDRVRSEPEEGGCMQEGLAAARAGEGV